MGKQDICFDYIDYIYIRKMSNTHHICIRDMLVNVQMKQYSGKKSISLLLRHSGRVVTS